MLGLELYSISIIHRFILKKLNMLQGIACLNAWVPKMVLDNYNVCSYQIG